MTTPSEDLRTGTHAKADTSTKYYTIKTIFSKT